MWEGMTLVLHLDDVGISQPEEPPWQKVHQNKGTRACKEPLCSRKCRLVCYECLGGGKRNMSLERGQGQIKRIPNATLKIFTLYPECNIFGR